MIIKECYFSVDLFRCACVQRSTWIGEILVVRNSSSATIFFGNNHLKNVLAKHVLPENGLSACGGSQWNTKEAGVPGLLNHLEGRLIIVG